jgi:hypothetical protein
MAKSTKRTIGAGVINVTSLDELAKQQSEGPQNDTDVLEEELPTKQEQVKPEEPLLQKENGVRPEPEAAKQPIVSAASILDSIGGNSSAKESVKPATILILKKIPKGSFRLGLEKQEDQPLLMPGAVHKFEPYMQGNNYLTTLANKPKDRERLEKILMVDLSPTSEYYATITYVMNDRPHGQFMSLDDTVNGAYEEVVYTCMIASPLVANGLHEYTSGKKPMAEWYIENKEAEAIIESNKVDTELKMFETLAIMPDSRRVEIAKIMRLPDAHTGSPTLIKTELFKVLKKGNKLMTADTAVNRFLTISAWEPQRIVVAAMVEDAENLNVIRLSRTKDWMYVDEVLGASKEEVVEFLMTPRASMIRDSIMNKVNIKLK